MTKFSKLPLLLQSMGRRPSEFRDRIETVLEVRRDRTQKTPARYQVISPLEAVNVLESSLGKPIHPFFQESNLTQIETEVVEGQRRLEGNAPFSRKHNGGTDLARFCYLVSRAINPAVVLETGVAYGVTSAYLLQAIEVNGRGELCSIDVPPLGPEADAYVGFLVPKDLRAPWKLHRGFSKRLLPKLLPSLSQVDLFVQDSLHTYRAIVDEITMVWPFLKPGGVVIADDVGDNPAFDDLAHRVAHSGYVVIRETRKDSMFGILIKHP